MKTQSGILFKSHLTLLLLAIGAGTFPASSSFGSGVYTHWTAYGANTATGLLGDSSVSLTTDIALYSYFTSPVTDATTNGTFPGYGTNYFTPSIPLTDTIGLAAGSSFTLTFQPPVTNPTLHIYQLSVNTWSFSDGTNPIPFQLVSSDGNFTIPTGSTNTTLTGSHGSGADASGSILFGGTFSRISWHSDDNISYDGADIQISIPYAVLTIQPANNGVVLLWPAAAPAFRLQQTTNLTTANWVTNTLPVNVVSGTNQVTVSPATGNLFFRLINP